MIIYVYDGTFEGLLTSIYNAFYENRKPYKIIEDRNIQLELNSDYIYYETDYFKAERVMKGIIENISLGNFKKIFYTFLSDNQDKGIHIYNYLKLGFIKGSDIDGFYQDDRIRPVIETSRRVSFEGHRFMGLLRFQEIDEKTLYAGYMPDNNITVLLMPHFSKRLSGFNLIIHDKGRKIAGFYSKNEWFIRDFDLEIEIDSEKESTYKELWRAYYETIGIKERKNHKLRQQFMPKKYWDYLCELQKD
jgi:probable DNA metabolism protein